MAQNKRHTQKNHRRRRSSPRKQRISGRSGIWLQLNRLRKRLPVWARLCILAVLLLLLSTFCFRVRNIEVSGNQRYTTEQITETCGFSTGDQLLTLNRTQAAARLLVKLPFLQQVCIHRRLPGTVVIEVAESTASAVVLSDYGTWWMISSDGKLLQEIDDEDPDFSSYPLLTGTEVTLPVSGDLAEYQDTATADILYKVLDGVLACGMQTTVETIDASDLSSVTVLYDNRLTVELGDASDAEYKLLYFLAVLDSLPADASGVVDVSFTSALEEQAIFHPYE